MKTLIFNTALAEAPPLESKRIFYMKDGKVRETTVLIAKSVPLAAMLTEHDDGTHEEDIREAIQAAALADDWTLANEIATRYGISACLRCGVDVASRPTWRLHRLGVKNNWGEICGSCAIKILEERT